VTGYPILDEAVWESLRSLTDDSAFLDELIDMFVDDALPRVERVRTSLASGDHATAQTAAHSLRGSAGNIGATEVAALAREIEHDLEAGVPVTVARADRLHDALHIAVAAILERRSQPRV
jgi:HPt (histidine-containing phosphotransfer) domain-containing protein